MSDTNDNLEVLLVGKVGTLEANYTALDKKVDLGFEHLNRAILENNREQRQNYTSLSDQLRKQSTPEKTNFSVIFSGLSLVLAVIAALGTAIIVPIINETQDQGKIIQELKDTQWSASDELRNQTSLKSTLEKEFSHIREIIDLKDTINDLKSQVRNK